MRNKLALTIALASFGVVTALGVGFAGAEGVATTETTEAVAPVAPSRPPRRSRPKPHRRAPTESTTTTMG